MNLDSPLINTCSRRRCVLCGEAGASLYEGLQDELFGASGAWGFRQCINPGCGLIWLDPAPAPSEMHKAYDSYYTHFHECVSGDDMDGVLRIKLKGLYGHLVHYTGLLRARRRMLFSHLDLMEPGRLLEIGCGDGSFLSEVKGRGWQVSGVDSDPRAVEAAFKKYGIVVQVGEFEHCEFPRGHFDMIVMNHVIEHVRDPIGFLASCKDILKISGMLLVVTPNSMGLGHSIFCRNWCGLDPPRHLQVFSPKTLRLTVERAGLKCNYFGTSSVNAETIFWWSIGNGLGMRGERAWQKSPPPLNLLFRSWLYQYQSLFINFFDKKKGEEIVMLCQKNI